MATVQVNSLSRVAETLLIPLYFRALETAEKEPIVYDDQARSLVQQIDYDFSRIEKVSADRVFSLMRCRYFDQAARTFLDRNPDGVVVDIGCGLGNRLSRIDKPGSGSSFNRNWYNLDLPEVMAIRSALLGENDRGCPIALSVLEPAWMAQVQVQPDQKCLFLAEGVLIYFTRADVQRLVLMLLDRFPDCELIFDALTPFLIHFHKLASSMRKAAAQLKWGVKDPREIERWAEGIQLLGCWRYFEQKEPRLGRAALIRFVPLIGKGSMILRYRLGIAGN